MTVAVQTIVTALGGALRGNPQAQVSCLLPFQASQASGLSFVKQLSGQEGQSTHTTEDLNQIQSACLVVRPQDHAAFAAQLPQVQAFILTPKPYLYFARLSQWWKRQQAASTNNAGITHAKEAGGNTTSHGTQTAALSPNQAIHPTAVIDPSAVLGQGVCVGPFTYIGPGVQVAQGVSLGAHCCIEEGVSIGEYSQLAHHISLGKHCVVGTHCIFHSGVVIGADGFGFAPDEEGRWEKIEHFGNVHIGNGVEVGANTCIDRGTLEDTVIEDGVKLDNLVQIGHNVHIGPHSALAGCAGVAGSTRLGAHCTVGGGGMVLGHLTLAEGVHISAASVATRSIQNSGSYTGFFPIDPKETWGKNAASLRQLHRLRQRVQQLEKQLALLEHQKA